MLPTRHYRLEDENEIRRLIAHHPWATFVSPTSRGLVASHYPVILDPTAEEPSTGHDTGFSLVSHFGRPDDTLHELGQHEVLVIVQGPHDYVSPSWYAPGDLVPTWNHVTAHLWGTPELLDHDENYTMLCRLTDHFEHGRDGGRNLLDDEPATRRAARGTRGLRIRVTRFEAKAKLSQNKAPEVVHNIIDQLEPDNPPLAAEMRNRTSDPVPVHSQETTMTDYTALPDDLPVPQDDGAADHLPGLSLPTVTLPSSDGHLVDLGALGPGRTVVYLYPLTGRPGVDLPDGWDAIPGARGCSTEACDFRDHFADLQRAGASRVYGLSSQSSDYQAEVVNRLRLPFTMLSDDQFRLAEELRLPTFSTEGHPRLHVRLTLVIREQRIEHVFYPVFPPNTHAQQVLGWLTDHPVP